MIPSFEIKNYRLFKHLTIDKLSRVNLITGKNNVGKTALLEALRIYTNYRFIEIFNKIFTARNELYLEPVKVIKNIFLNFDIENQKIIKLGPKDNKEKSLNIYYDILRDTTIKALKNAALKKDKSRLFIDKGTEEYGFMLNSDTFQSADNSIIDDFDFFIPSTGAIFDNISDWWYEIITSQNKNFIIDGLKLIDPGIEEISPVIQKFYNNKIFFLAEISGLKSLIPLNSMGEGLTRILGICFALVNAKNGTLLIDEIENGIHYTVQPKLWKLIFEMAEKLNVQVFATTHSWDAVEGFQKALSEFHDPEQGQLIRLDEFDGDISTTIFSANELSIATRNNIEVR